MSGVCDGCILFWALYIISFACGFNIFISVLHVAVHLLVCLPPRHRLAILMMPPPSPCRKRPANASGKASKGGPRRKGTDRSVSFMISKQGERVLLIDQWHYVKDSENPMLVFWRCIDANTSNCPARVATTKKERNVRVVVINDAHIHVGKRRLSTTTSAATTTIKRQSSPVTTRAKGGAPKSETSAMAAN